MLHNRIMKITFTISLVGHCLFLGMPKFNLNLPQAEKAKDIIVKIEIEKPPLLPKIDVLGEEKKLKEIMKESKSPESEPEPEPEEIVMDESPKEPIEEKVEVIDPAQEAMLRYQDMVKQRIEEVRRYPSWARRQGIEGDVYLSFIVLSNGLSKNTKIIFSSGVRVLDEEAVATIKRAEPFPPIPEEISATQIQMQLAIVFKIN